MRPGNSSQRCQSGAPEVLRGGKSTCRVELHIASAGGIGRAKELLLIGDFMEGSKAERIGLVNRAVPLADLDKEVMSIAKKLLGSALSVQLVRACVDFGLESTLDAVLEVEEEASCLSVASGERERTALGSFRKK